MKYILCNETWGTPTKWSGKSHKFLTIVSHRYCNLYSLGLFPLSQHTKSHNVSETGSFQITVWCTCVVTIEEVQINISDKMWNGRPRGERTKVKLQHSLGTTVGKITKPSVVTVCFQLRVTSVSSIRQFTYTHSKPTNRWLNNSQDISKYVPAREGGRGGGL